MSRVKEQGLDLSAALECASRVAVVGIGSEMRGDDAAGVLVARNLKKRVNSLKVLIIDAGVAPESFTSQIKEFKPSHVILIDAADFGAEPGAVIFTDSSAAVGQSISTHRLPLSVLSNYLRNQTSAKVFLVGIQPSRAEIGGKMSEKVTGTVEEITKILVKKLRSIDI